LEVVRLLLGELYLLLHQFFIDFGNILRNDLGVAMWGLRIVGIHILVSHLLYLLYLLLLHTARATPSILVASALV